MKSKRHRFALAIIFALAFLVNVPGLKWGLPGEKIFDLVIGDKKLHQILIPIMVETRDEIRDMIKIPGQTYDESYDENKIIHLHHNEYDVVLNIAQINAMRTFLLRTYYPDEHITIVALTNMDVMERQFNPKVLIPGCFYIYSSGIWLAIGEALGTIKLSKNLDYYLKNVNEIGKIYLWMRILILLSFFISVWFLWLVGKTFWNEKVSLIASCLFAISPVMNLWNHFGYYYTFSLPFVIMVFYYSGKILISDRIKNYILAGIFSGISASVVLLYGISFIFLVTAFFVKIVSFRISKNVINEMSKKLFYGFLSMFCTFFLINIFLLTDIKTLYQLMKFEQGDFIFSFSPFLFVFGSLKSACGWPFLLSAISGFVLACLRKKDNADIFLVFSVIIPLILLSCFSPWYARRGIFLIPFMALLSGLLFKYIGKKIILQWIFFPVFILTLTYSASYTKIFVQENIRDRAGRWINTNIPDNTEIGLVQYPAPYRTPPFQFHRYKLIPVKWDKNLLEDLNPAYFIVSEYEIQNMDESFLEYFFEDYIKIKEFKMDSVFVDGISFKRTKFSARDFWIPNPCITIYKRKNVER